MSWWDRIRGRESKTERKSPIEKVASSVFKMPDVTISEDDLFSDRPSISQHAERLKATVRSMNFNKDDLPEEKLRQAGRVRKFLEDSRANWGPFKFAIAELLNKPGELEYALSEWDLEKPEERAKYEQLHRLYFGCFDEKDEMVGGVICAVQLEAGHIEIGGIAGSGQRGRGFGSSAIPAILVKLSRFEPYRQKIRTVTSETQADNFAAQRMLEKCGFVKIRENEEGLVYEMPFEKIPTSK